MMVSPELISASKAPSANPLNTCEMKFGQLIMKCNHGAWLQPYHAIRRTDAKNGAADIQVPRRQGSDVAQV